MQHSTRRTILIGAAVAIVAVGGYRLLGSTDKYHVTVPLASAANLVSGGPVMENGFQVGTVSSIKAVDGKAMVSMDLDKQYAPLHDGATVDMSWKALLSERQLQLVDGPASNPTIPDGGMVPGVQPAPVELDQVLNALDAPTRAQLKGFIADLRQTLRGHETAAHETLTTAGPALAQLGSLLTAVGTDGPAIRDLVARMSAMLTQVDQHNSSVQAVVDNLATLTAQIAQQRGALSTALHGLPNTLALAQTALERVPAAAQQAVPLLQDLAPATGSLTSVSTNLKPLLGQLTPAVADLDPTLAQLRGLLGVSPQTLNSLNALLPELQTTLTGAKPATSFLRPYSPEIAGWISTWDSAMANYDSLGHYTRLLLQAGPTSVDGTSEAAAPGSSNDPYPAPGGIVGQPWTDANGSTLR